MAKMTGKGVRNGVTYPITPYTQDGADGGGINQWPHDIGEAYSRGPGPYTIQDVAVLLEEESLELYNGWLVWQEMTDPLERRIVAAIQEILSIAARAYGFGQAYPDQFECLLSNGDLVKPDICLLSDARFASQVAPISAKKSTRHQVLKGSPELAIEVRSPSNRRTKERLKREKYFANGALLVWDVDPIKQEIWVYTAPDSVLPREFKDDDLIDCEPLLPDWRRRTGDFFTPGLSAEQIVGQVAAAWRIDERAKTLQDMLMRQAGQRFGADQLPPELEARLASYTIAQLNNLVDTIATSNSLADWLATLPA